MLEKVIELIDKSNDQEAYLKFDTPFSSVSTVYYFTNENILDYFNQLDFKNVSSALTVCASGDQIFNLVHKNVGVIDAFDTNGLTEYFSLGIKCAAIKTFLMRNL